MDQAALANRIVPRDLDERGENQIWIAISVYVLGAMIKKQLGLDGSLYTILQIFSVTALEQLPIYQVLRNSDYKSDEPESNKQLLIIDL